MGAFSPFRDDDDDLPALEIEDWLKGGAGKSFSSETPTKRSTTLAPSGNLHLSALRTESLSFRVEEFINHRILIIANQTLLEAIHQEAIKKNMPKRYIQSIQSDYDGTYLWIWVDFKGKDLEPLDEWFEEGTPDHPILPKRKKALMWIHNGIKYFSKGHWISGMQAKHVFSEGFKKGYPEFKKKLQEELEVHLKETMFFGR